MPNTPTPHDPLRDLLIRLDQKVTDGFASVEKKLDKMERKTDAHDLEIRGLDRRITIIENTATNFSTMIKAMWVVLAATAIPLFAKIMGLW